MLLLISRSPEELTFVKNIFSGFVVSLIALPLGLGLALASEAPPIAGIVAAIAGGMVVSVLGGSHLTITGPGNGLVIVILSAIIGLGEGDLYQGYLFTLAAIIISGILLFLFGLFSSQIRRCTSMDCLPYCQKIRSLTSTTLFTSFFFMSTHEYL